MKLCPLRLVFVSITSTLFFSCVLAQDGSPVLPQEPEEVSTLYEHLKTSSNFLTFTTVIDAVGLQAMLDDESSPYTILAPVDSAFGTMDGKYLQAQWNAWLTALIRYHVITDSVDIDVWNPNMTYPTLFSDKEVAVTVSKIDPLSFDDYAIVTDFFQAKHGFVYTIDQVLLPDSGTAGATLLAQTALNPELSEFFNLLERLNLTAVLDTEGPWTLLIPTNAAFAKIPSAIFNGLSEDALFQIALYHLVPSIEVVYDMGGSEPKTVSTMHGTSLQLSQSGGGVTRDSLQLARFQQTDVMASNGIWHTVDNVLIPLGTADGVADSITNTPTNVPTTAPSSALSIATTIVSTLDSSADTDSDLDAEDNNDLQQTTFSPTTSLSMDDSEAIHMTDFAVTDAPTTTEISLWETIQLYNDLTDFSSALMLADLDFILNNNTAATSELTVFAPVNAAFAAMPLKLYQPAWKLHLEALLLYHIIETDTAQLSSDMILDLNSDPTTTKSYASLQGDALKITDANPNLVINDIAQIMVADSIAQNGVMHILNNLLIPPFFTKTVAETVETEPELSVLAQLLRDSNILSELNQMEKSWTLMAPVNAAFDGMDVNSMTPETKVELMKYHLIPQVLPADNLIHGTAYTTLQGSNATIMNVAVGENVQLRVRNGTVVEPNALLAYNGIIHFIDTVLIPSGTSNGTTSDADADNHFPVDSTDAPSVTPVDIIQVGAAATMSPTSLPEEAEDVVDIVTTVGAITNAPTVTVSQSATDEFSAAPSAAPPADVADQSLTNTDNPTTLFPVTAAPVSPTNDPSTSALSLGQVIRKKSDYSALYSMLDQSMVGTTMEMQGPWTIFGPNNAAFEQLPGFIFDELDSESLVHLLSYHIVPGAYRTDDLEEGMVLLTLQGSSITVTTEYARDGPNELIRTIFLTDDNGDSAEILLENEMAANGIFHGIANVLLPARTDVTFAPTKNSSPTAAQITSNSPTSTKEPFTVMPTIAVTNGNSSITETSSSVEHECDSQTAAFAPNCCPVTDPGLTSFCLSLINRPKYGGPDAARRRV